MHVDAVPTLIEQFRETFEGEVHPGWCWIIDGKDPNAGLLATLAGLTVAQAFQPPAPGSKPVAAHAAHLRFALDLLLRRMDGEDPGADWTRSFDVPPATEEAWQALQRDLRRAYDGVVAFLQRYADAQPQDLPPIHLVGLSANIAHNAYHLGAIRQIARVVTSKAQG